MICWKKKILVNYLLWNILGSTIGRWWSHGFGWDLLYGSWVWVATNWWLGTGCWPACYVVDRFTEHQGLSSVHFNFYTSNVTLCIFHYCFIVFDFLKINKQEVLLFPAMKPQDEAPVKGTFLFFKTIQQIQFLFVYQVTNNNELQLQKSWKVELRNLSSVLRRFWWLSKVCDE